jgi:hypothetical protein
MTSSIMIDSYRTPEIDLDDRLRWLAMDLENLRWHLSEKKYLPDDVIEKLYTRIDAIKDNNRQVKERMKSG